MEEAQDLTGSMRGRRVFVVSALYMSSLKSGLNPRVRELLSQSNLMIKLRSRIEDFVWEVDMEEGCSAREGFWASIHSRLRRLHAIHTALDRCWDLIDIVGRLNMSLRFAIILGTLKSASLERSFEDIDVILALLSLVYQYLTGNVDNDHATIYSATSLDFRDIFISIVLFQGSYVWIKFREVAGFKGVVKRKIHDKRGNIRVVFEPRFKPPRENGKKYEWIYITQCATVEEASIVHQIAAFYYNQVEGQLDLGDGRFFTIPPMSLEEESLTGMQKRAWLPPKVKKVYEDYKHARANVVQEATLLMDFTQDYGDKETQGSDDRNGDHSQASLLNRTNILQQHLPVTYQIHDSRMDIAIPDNQGLECTSHCFDGVHEDLAVFNGHSLGFQEEAPTQEGSATPNPHCAIELPNCNELDMILLLVANQQEIISNQQKLFFDEQKQLQLEFKAQLSDQQQQVQELEVQISELKNQYEVEHQLLQDAKIQISQLQDQRCLQQQLLDISQEGFWNEVLMESMHQQTYPWVITSADDGTEAWEAFK